MISGVKTAQHEPHVLTHRIFQLFQK